jgi:ribonucleoside-diphosphate reductase alpha chain
VDLAGMAASAPVSAPVGAASAPAEEKAPVVQEKETPVSAGSSTELLEIVTGQSADAPLCFTCGTKMRRAGSCYVCEGCGSTSGCS